MFDSLKSKIARASPSDLSLWLRRLYLITLPFSAILWATIVLTLEIIIALISIIVIPALTFHSFLQWLTQYYKDMWRK